MVEKTAGVRHPFGRAACLALCLALVSPTAVWASGGPLISGIESDSEPAEGPGVEEAAGSEAESQDTASEEAAGYTEAQLGDALIEYGELEALIRTGNSTAINSQNSYQTSLEIYQTAYDSLLSARRDMLNEADELEDAGGDEALIGNYEQNASILSASAQQMKRSITSLNSRSSEWSRDQAVWTLVKTAQSLMASCKEMEAQAETAAALAFASQAAYDKTAAMRTAGMATEEEVLAAKKSLLSAQSASQSAADSADRLKRQLAIMLGKEVGSIELGEIPQVTAEELSSLNLEEDKALAVIANSGVKSVKRSRAQGDAERKLRSQQLSEAEGAASVTADEQYQNVAALSQERDAALKAFAAAEKDYGVLQTKYRAGLINKSTYLSGTAEYLQTKASKITAEAELRTALDAYQWMLKGVR